MVEVKSIFTDSYITSYETASSRKQIYERAAYMLVNRLLATGKQLENVLEVGPGTGNSTTVLLEHIPGIHKLYGIEISNFITLAHDKQRGGRALERTIEKNPDGSAAQYIREISHRLQPYKDKLVLLRSDGHNLPLPAHAVSAVAMNQSFHWLHPDVAIPEFSRVLEPEGLVVFDESGYHFDFGQTSQGRSMNERHFTKHPFFVAFHKELPTVLREEGIQVAEPKEFSNQFTYQKLVDLFRAYGFVPVPDAQGNEYSVTVVPYAFDDVRFFTEHGARMVIAQTLPDALLQEGLVDTVISRTLERIEKRWDGANGGDAGYAETLAAFAFQKQ